MKITGELQKVVDKFSLGLQKIEDDMKQQRENLIKEIEGVKRQQVDLKAQGEEQGKRANNKLALLNDKIAQQTNLNNGIKNEISTYNKLSTELAESAKEQKINLENIKIEKSLITIALNKTKETENEYKIKTQALHVDYTKLDRLKIEFASRDRKIVAKEKVQSDKDSEFAQRSNDLSHRELKLTAREVEVKRLIEAYELERFIKENKKKGK